MGFLKKIFKKNNDKNKYNIKAENNQSRMVYGIPDPNLYNREPKKNKPPKEHDVSSSKKLNDSFDGENAIKNKCYEIMQFDPFWGEILDRYMNSLNLSDEKKLEYLNKLETDRAIVNEFSKFLVGKKYDIPNAIEVNGKTAKIIFEENPELTAIEIYLKLIDEKKK